MILILDDCKEICNLISEYLNIEGYKSIAFQDSKKALEHYFKTQDIDLIIVDYNISNEGTKGNIVIEYMNEVRPVKSIMMSGMCFHRDENVNTTWDLMLNKPFTVHELLEMVAKCQRIPK